MFANCYICKPNLINQDWLSLKKQFKKLKIKFKVKIDVIKAIFELLSFLVDLSATAN